MRDLLKIDSPTLKRRLQSTRDLRARNTAQSRATTPQQIFNNANTTTGTLNNLYNNQYNWLSNALNNQTNIAQQQFNNMTASNSNSALYQALLQNSGLPITTLAAAQEGLLGIPTTLWNASLGLTGQNLGALNALAGTGSTETSARSSGGSFLSGLFG